jgi:Na+-translocating ferredoxin:NAD+ oxidoreductase RnfE subunit
MELMAGPDGIVVYSAFRHKMHDERLRQFMLIINSFTFIIQMLPNTYTVLTSSSAF